MANGVSANNMGRIMRFLGLSGRTMHDAALSVLTEEDSILLGIKATPSSVDPRGGEIWRTAKWSLHTARSSAKAKWRLGVGRNLKFGR